MDDGILSVRLCPEWDSPNIRSALEASLSKFTLLQGAVAYWTVSDPLLNNRISPALRHDSGFICVDLHLPTDVDALASLARSGANVSLFCEDITTYSESGRKDPPYLLHPKMLLFWSADKAAELWVGSHNWTQRAILGLNIEASAVISLTVTSPMFYQAAAYLRKISSICEKFDISQIAFYKELQKRTDERTVPVIEVEASEARALARMEITIFGTDLKDLSELGTIRRRVYLSATENDAHESEFVYPAQVTQVGELNSTNPSAGELAFSPRRHAFRLGRSLPELLPYRGVAPTSVKNARYYVTLELQDIEDSIKFEYPNARTATWEVADPNASPLIRRLGTNERIALFRNREPKVKLPTLVEPQTTHALTLYERRSLTERSFLSKRVMKRQQ
jgi:hypothetical protein